MPVKNKIIVKDLGWARILQELRKIDNSYSKVGFPENADVKPGSKKKNKKGIKPIGSMSELATLAAWLNFGTKRNPKSWPFMFLSFVNNVPALINLRNKLYIKITKGTMTTEQALMLMGEFMTAKLKKEITNLRSPALEPETVKRKKSSNPLIDTAVMRNSITHVEVIK